MSSHRHGGRLSEKEKWQRAAELGAVLDVHQVVDVGGSEVELLHTLADCIGTRLVYRAPRMSGIWPRASWPPEIAHGGGSHGGDDFSVGEFDPVLPERTSIVIGFAHRLEDLLDRRTLEIRVAVDRRRSSVFERYLAEPRPAMAQTDGVTFEVLDARVGVMSGVVEMAITPTDASIIAAEIGWPSPNVLPIRGGPGPEFLWRDWHPRQADVTTRRQGPGGMTTMSMASSFKLTARRRKEDQPPRERQDPPPDPPTPVVVVSIPGRERLGGNGYGRGGSPMLRGPKSIANISHDPPPEDASGLEVAIAGLYLFRYGGGRIVTIPKPAPDAVIDLGGAAFESEFGRVELLRWEPGFGDSTRLILRTPGPHWYPDVRVIQGDESVSLWTHPWHQGTVSAGLPRMYDPAFEHPEGVRLALRMLGVPAPEVRIPIALSAPGSAHSSSA